MSTTRKIDKALTEKSAESPTTPTLVQDAKQEALAYLDSFFYEQHFNFCLEVLNIMACDASTPLTELVFGYQNRFKPLRSGKNIPVYAEQLKAAFSSEGSGQFNELLITAGLQFFLGTWELAYKQQWDELADFVLAMHAKAPEAKEDKGRGPVSGLRQNSVHTSTGSSSSSSEGQSASSLPTIYRS